MSHSQAKEAHHVCGLQLFLWALGACDMCRPVKEEMTGLFVSTWGEGGDQLRCAGLEDVWTADKLEGSMKRS